MRGEGEDIVGEEDGGDGDHHWIEYEVGNQERFNSVLHSMGSETITEQGQDSIGSQHEDDVEQSQSVDDHFLWRQVAIAETEAHTGHQAQHVHQQQEVQQDHNGVAVLHSDF